MKTTSEAAQKSRKGNGSGDAADAEAGDPALQNSDRSAQEERIAVAAYFRAEQRGFAPGNEMEDWFQSESEYNADLNRNTP